jgi:hypothetical protein
MNAEFIERAIHCLHQGQAEEQRDALINAAAQGRRMLHRGKISGARTMFAPEIFDEPTPETAKPLSVLGHGLDDRRLREHSGEMRDGRRRGTRTHTRLELVRIYIRILYDATRRATRRRRGIHAGLAMNRIFEVLGKNKKYIEFYHHTERAAAARARGPCNMARRQLEAT